MSRARFVVLPGQRRCEVGSVDLGRIVDYGGRYGVVVAGGGSYHRRVDFWDGPPENLPGHLRVDVLPARRYVPTRRGE